MYTHPTLLKKLELLSRDAFKIELKAGMRVARGFADLGYEEFFLLPNCVILSLFSGDQKEFHSADAKNFFCVPEPDELIAEFLKQGIKVIELGLKENGTIVNVVLAKIGDEDGNTASGLADTILEALVDAALVLHGLSTKEEKRTLRVQR